MIDDKLFLTPEEILNKEFKIGDCRLQNIEKGQTVTSQDAYQDGNNSEKATEEYRPENCHSQCKQGNGDGVGINCFSS